MGHARLTDSSSSLHPPFDVPSATQFPSSLSQDFLTEPWRLSVCISGSKAVVGPVNGAEVLQSIDPAAAIVQIRSL